MSALAKLNDAIKEKFPQLDQDIQDFIEEYIEKDKQAYFESKSDGKLSFGKYKGYSLDELASSTKGKEYLQWLMAQSFFSEDKFGHYHKKLKELGIKKKPTTKRVPLA